LNTHPCFFCDQEVEFRTSRDISGEDVTCPRCGDYSIEIGAIRELNASRLEPRVQASASGWIHEFGAAPTIDVERLKFFRHQLQPLNVAERAERLMRLIAKMFPGLTYANVLNVRHPGIAGVSWSESAEEVEYLLVEYLAKGRGLIKAELVGGSEYQVVILPAGWEYIESLKFPNVASHLGFIAMWFDPSMEEPRQRGLIAGIRAAGFREFVIDQHLSNDEIVDEILAAIRRSRFVVAEYTGNRHNVYYEAGFAHGLRIPVIRTCRKDEIGKITFDVNHYPFILWDTDQLDAFGKRLANHIQATIGVGPFAQHESNMATTA
jgi:hypothetical protein